MNSNNFRSLLEWQMSRIGKLSIKNMSMLSQCSFMAEKFTLFKVSIGTK